MGETGAMTALANPSKPETKGGILLILGIVSLVGGIAAGIIGLVVGIGSITDTIDDFERVPADRGGSIQIDETGTHGVYLERPGASESYAFVPSVQFDITGPDGQPLQVDRGDFDVTYEFGEHEGRRIGEFEADETGTYQVVVSGIRSDTGIGGLAGDELAVGSGDPEGGFAVVGLSILGGGLLAVLGIVLLIIGGVRRSKSKKPPAGPYGAGALPGWGAPPAGPGGWATAPTGAPGTWNQPQQGWGAPPAPPVGPTDRPGWAPPATTPQPPAAPPSWPPAPPAGEPGQGGPGSPIS